MTFTVSTAYAADYAHFDGYELVTFTEQNPAGTPVTSVPAIRYPVGESLIGSGDLGSEDYDVVFHLWNGSLSTAVPKNGDIVTDASSVVWTVITSSKRGYEPQWELRCRKQR